MQYNDYLITFNCPNIWHLIQFTEKAATSEDIDILCKHEHPGVRLACARRKIASRQALEHLSQSNESEVRHAVAKNKKTPKKVIKRLVMDDVSFVADAARQHKNAKDFIAFF
jgi:hypothetical protein